MIVTERPHHYEDWSTPDLITEQAALRELEAARTRERDGAGRAPISYPGAAGPVDWDTLQRRLGRVEHLLRPMSPFVGGAVSPWPAGEERLHLYALPDRCGRGECDGGELLAELDRQGPILAGHRDLVTAVPDAWLHITIGRLDQATAHEADLLANAIGQWVERLTAPPVKGLMTPTVAEHGVLLDEGAPDPRHRPPGWSWESSLEGMAALLRTGARVADIEATRLHSPRSFHLATAYCHTVGPGRALADRIGRTRPPISVRVRTLALVWVAQDPAAPAYTWRTVASWPLG